MKEEKLFGTDGIRGVAYEYPLIEDLIRHLGFVAGRILAKEKGKALIGSDTRESCFDLKKWLIEGLTSTNIDCYDCGIFPTAGISAMVKNKGFDFGIVISASHNPYHDNGIKFFNQNGEKLNEEIEEQIENELKRTKLNLRESNRGEVKEIDLVEDYISFILRGFNEYDFLREPFLVDLANGSAVRIAKKLFEKLGLKALIINDKPDGKNINRDCGSLFVSKLHEKLIKENLDFGFSLDGDADRCLLSLRDGTILDGDYLIYNETTFRKNANLLKKNVVVGTLMTNYGLEVALKREGLELIRTKVGDKYVYEALKRNGAEIGGEPSGHVIFLYRSITGDGLISLLTYLYLAKAKGSIFNLKEGLKLYPQQIINLKVKEKIPLEQIDGYEELNKKAYEMIEGEGRIVLRYSGTEPLLRIMVESKSENNLKKALDYLIKELSKILKKEE